MKEDFKVLIFGFALSLAATTNSAFSYDRTGGQDVIKFKCDETYKNSTRLLEPFSHYEFVLKRLWKSNSEFEFWINKSKQISLVSSSSEMLSWQGPFKNISSATFKVYNFWEKPASLYISQDSQSGAIASFLCESNPALTVRGRHESLNE